MKLLDYILKTSQSETEMCGEITRIYLKYACEAKDEFLQGYELQLLLALCSYVYYTEPPKSRSAIAFLEILDSDTAPGNISKLDRRMTEFFNKHPQCKEGYRYYKAFSYSYTKVIASSVYGTFNDCIITLPYTLGVLYNTLCLPSDTGTKENCITQNIKFQSQEHLDFYLENIEKCKKQDCYHKALIYLLGVDEELRPRLRDIFDFEDDCVLSCGVTGAFTKQMVDLCMFACTLFSDGLKFERMPELSDLLCGGYGVYVLEGLKLRYELKDKPLLDDVVCMSV